MVATGETYGNDYEAWCYKLRDKSLLEGPPLDYWTSQAIVDTYPRSQELAITIFPTPAMSDEPERVFSSCGLMIRPHRSTISPKIVAAPQCLRSWSREGLVTYNIFNRMEARIATLERVFFRYECPMLYKPPVANSCERCGLTVNPVELNFLSSSSDIAGIVNTSSAIF